MFCKASAFPSVTLLNAKGLERALQEVFTSPPIFTTGPVGRPCEGPQKQQRVLRHGL